MLGSKVYLFFPVQFLRSASAKTAHEKDVIYRSAEG
jgi:hypothetical protein